MKSINLNIGELGVTRELAVFNCYGLGSCLGVFMFDSRRQLAGGAHIMLPGEDDSLNDNTAYAEPAIRSLYQQLLALDSGSQLKAKIVGGAKLMMQDTFEVGYRNIQQVKRLLKILKIPVVAEDIGGNVGRTARFFYPATDLIIRNSKGKTYTI